MVFWFERFCTFALYQFEIQSAEVNLKYEHIEHILSGAEV